MWENNVTLEMSKGAQHLSYKSSNFQMCKPVFLTTFEWPPQLCIQKKAPCHFTSHLEVFYLCRYCHTQVGTRTGLLSSRSWAIEDKDTQCKA